MSVQQQMEDLIEEAAWRERNGLDQAVDVVRSTEPMTALRQQANRDYPMDYDPDIPVISRSWIVSAGVAIAALAFGCWIGWNLFKPAGF